MADSLQQQRHIPSVLDDSAPFQLRGASLTLLTLKLVAPDDPQFFPGLAAMLGQAPGFYRNAPIVLDLSPLVRARPIDLAAFCVRLRGLGLLPVGFQGATVEWEQAAEAAGLSAFPAGRATDQASVRPRGAPLAKPAAARVVSQPVRSGQQIYAPQGDLIVTAPVSPGAELLADGHIHVYGKLRGRALAGMGGDATARIFCKALHADLVSIAGIYLVSEQIDQKFTGKAVQIRLDGEKLVVEALG
ncbi:MAG: septum site-determining protein MinC [Magnetospirillum sp.]|nr:septum site-determining protein MinC [Magnetospirillum sp.]